MVYHHPVSQRGGSMRRFSIAAAAAVATTPALAQEKIDFILNWVPGGDHAPYYYAKKLGWYQKEVIDLNLEPGKGSALSTQRVGAGANPVGLADMAGVLVAKGKGANSVAVFNVYANSPQGMYWLKSSGIKGIKDFAGKKIGNPAGDRSEEHTSELQSRRDLVCRLLLEKKKKRMEQMCRLC